MNRDTKHDFAVFASKIQLLSTDVCCEVTLCETSIGKFVATSFLCLMVHRRIAGDVFGVAFHFFVAGNHRHFKFGLQIDHSKCQRTHDKLSLKGARSCHVIHFKFQGPKHTSRIT